MKTKYVLLVSLMCASLSTFAQGHLSASSEAVLLGRQLGERIIPGQPVEPEIKDKPAKAPSLNATQADEFVNAFIEFWPEADKAATIERLEALGVQVRTDCDEFVTSSIPIDDLRKVADCEGVKFVQVGHKAEVKNVFGRTDIGGDWARLNPNGELPKGFTGNGVVIGIIDTGLEYDHLALREADGMTYRVRRVWNQNGVGRAPAKFGYGTEYTTQAELKAANCDTAGEWHATHVAGIATGSDMTKFEIGSYNGVATEADIVFVSFGNDDTNITDAIQYIFDYADEVDKPCVINMSLGQHIGPHDGSSYLDRRFKALSGPGRILVGAVGNEGMDNLHASKTFAANNTDVLKTMLAYPSASASKTVHIDIWGSEGSTFEVSVGVVNALNGRFAKQSSWISSNGGALTQGFSQDQSGADCTFQITSQVVNGRPNMYVISKVTSINDTRKIGIQVRGQQGETVHMWNVGGYDFSNGGLNGWTAGDNNITCGEIGGISEDVISVGSYDTFDYFEVYWDKEYMYKLGEEQVGYVVDFGHLSPFSSRGPTVDGRMKPDVLAPGAVITSASSKYMLNWGDKSPVATLRSEAPDGEYFYYGLNIGTSMATPFVTGTVALWLEAEPTLTVADVRDVIARTSRHDDYIGTEVDNNNGYGKINAYNGLLDILHIAGVTNVEVDETSVAYEFDRSMNTLNIAVPSEGTASVVATNGQLIAKQALTEGGNNISTAAWPSGIYIVNVVTRGQNRTFKIAK